MIRPLRGWGVMWNSVNRLDGPTAYLVWGPLFRTRRECRDFIEKVYGYMRKRPDLRDEPHGWRVPKAVRVKVTAQERKP